jgi:hypothetical protein
MAFDPVDLDPLSSGTSSNPSQSGTETPPAPVGFHFVNISEPTEIHGPQNRSRVRSLVAQNYRRNRILKHSEGSAHPCMDRDVASMYPVLNFCPVCGYSLTKNRTSSDALDNSSSVRAPAVPLNLNSLGAGRVDPFGAFPIPVQPYMHVLIDHCKSHFA